MKRLALILAGLALAGAAPASRAEFVTLGTGGGPLTRLERSEPANAVVVDGDVYLFDVGDGVQRQLVAAGLPLGRVKALFLSHHHLDHNGGLAPLLVTRWLLNNHSPVPVIGPPATERMVAGIAEAYRPTELAPITIGGPPTPPILATAAAKDMPAELDIPQVVYQDAKIRVLAVGADHYHYAPGSPEAKASRSYAFRIEAGGRSFVFTGDTGPSRRVEALANGADVLVTEVIDLAATERALRAATDLPPSAIPGMLAHMQEDHLTPEQIDQFAARTGVKTVVLTHFSPGLDGERDLSGYTRGLGAAFKGSVKLARDLDRF